MTVDIPDTAYLCLSVWKVGTEDFAQAGTYSFSISEGGCCEVRGDIDHSGGEAPIDIADLVYLVDFMFLGGAEPPCFDEGDVDASGSAPIDIADLVYLVDYMFNSGPEPSPCP